MGDIDELAAAVYTFGHDDFLRWMPVVATDSWHGQLLECPICTARLWTVCDYPDKHWQGHGIEKANAPQ